MASSLFCAISPFSRCVFCCGTEVQTLKEAWSRVRTSLIERFPEHFQRRWRAYFLVTLYICIVVAVLAGEHKKTGTVYLPPGGWYTTFGINALLSQLKDC